MGFVFSKRATGILQVTLASICFGFLGVFGRLAFQNELQLGELLTYRFAFAAFVLGLFLCFTKPQLLRISKPQVQQCALLGFFGYAVFSTLYFRAIEGVSVAFASLLLYTYPIFVAVLARVFLKEKLTRSQKIALPVAILGLSVLLGAGQWLASNPSPNFLAVLSGLGAALCYAGYIVVSSHWQKKIDPLSSGFFVMSFAALGLFLFHQPDLSRLASFTLKQDLIILGLAIVCTILPLVLFLSGLQRLGNNEASLLGTVEPLTAAIMGSLLLGEHLEVFVWVGGALVMTSLILTALDFSQRR